MVSRTVNLALRGLEFFFTLVVMAMVGNLIAMGGAPSIINYDMFTVVFGMLSLFYLIAVAFNDGFTGHPVIPLALDALNVLFYFCAAVAMAAQLGAHSCSNGAWLVSNRITLGDGGRCREAQATTAFLWFAWACFVVSLFFSIAASRGSANMRVPGIRRVGLGKV